MGGYTTGQVERILGLPASTLRFWEKEVPFLSPRKDFGGRRVYSAADIVLLSRLRHLALEKGLGLHRASRILEAEMLEGDPGIWGPLSEIRSRLHALQADAIELARRLEGNL